MNVGQVFLDVKQSVNLKKAKKVSKRREWAKAPLNAIVTAD